MVHVSASYAASADGLEVGYALKSVVKTYIVEFSISALVTLQYISME